MNAKILNLIHGNTLIFWQRTLLRPKTGRKSTKCPNIEFASANCSNWVNYNRNKGVLELLIQQLSANIDTRQPAAIAWMGVIPANYVLLTANTLGQPAFLTFLTQKNAHISNNYLPAPPKKNYIIYNQ